MRFLKTKLLHCYIATLLKRAKQLNNLTIKQFNNGFTLIETVVVLGILTFVMGSTLVFITNILKGNNQARINAEVKQAGQVVLDTLESQIRNAVSVTPEGINIPRIMITKADSTPLYIYCFNASPTANGWIGTSPNDIDWQTLTNQDWVSGVSISSCSFTVIGPSTNSPALVKIEFIISQGLGSPLRKDFEAKAPFRTTISLRSYK